MATKIAFIHNGKTRFIETDLQLLCRHFEVTELFLRTKRHNPTVVLKQLKRQDLILGWFASWHTLVPVLVSRWMGKPAILIVGGYDTANVPAAGYGSQRGGLRRIVANMGINNATQIIAFSQNAQRETISNAGVDPQKITTIYMGLEPKEMVGSTVRGQLVLTVGQVWRENLLRKGLLPYVQSAAYLPEVKFIHVGKWFDDSINELRRAAGPNVELKGFVSDEELDELYARAAVYVQPSLHEGFGMSVAEAMLAGCIPVVTRNGSLPEVVGDTGVYCASNEPQDIAAAIKQALTMNGEARMKAHERIINEFPLEKREKSLVRLIEEAVSGS